MNIVIRTDSSTTIGSGHLMRCLTLAGRLRHLGASIAFVCRDLPGSLCDEVKKKGFLLYRLCGDSIGKCIDIDTDIRGTTEIIREKAPVNWLIVDHYGLDNKWENGLRDEVEHLMVIDDLANRRHDCDLLLDQNLYNRAEARYNNLVPDNCQKLLGPEYALLRYEFAKARTSLRSRSGSINRILISMGGADLHNITTKVLGAMENLNRPDIFLDVVVGAANPHAEDIRNRCQSFQSCAVHHPARGMAGLMAVADLSFGAGGSTTWERCCLGLPNLFIASGNNETEIARSAETAGIGKYLGSHDEVTPRMLARQVQMLFERPDLMCDWSYKAALLVDGLGAERVCHAIMEYSPAEVGS